MLKQDSPLYGRMALLVSDAFTFEVTETWEGTRLDFRRADDTREAGAAAHRTRRRRAAPRRGAARGSRARGVAFSGAASYAALGGHHGPTNASLTASYGCEPVIGV